MHIRKSFHKLKALLTQPYPLPSGAQEHIIQSVGSGVFVAAFLLIFNPFGLHNLPAPFKEPVIAGYGLITTACMLLNFWIARKFFPKQWAEETWTLGKQISWSMVHILSIAAGNTLYSYALGFIQLDLFGFGSFLFITLAVGIFPVVGITLANYMRLLKLHVTDTAGIRLSQRATRQENRENVVELLADNEKDHFRFSLDELLFILSSDNYATIFFREGEHLRKELIRSSLTRLEQQLHEPFVQRCHRSYIVNLRQVTAVSGNAQGYQLSFDLTEDTVPVSRKYSKIILAQLQRRSY